MGGGCRAGDGGIGQVMGGRAGDGGIGQVREG